MPATNTNTMLIAGASTGPNLESQTPQIDLLQEGYWEALTRLSEAIQEGATNNYIKNLQG